MKIKNTFLPILITLATTLAHASWLGPVDVSLSADGQTLYSIERESRQIRKAPADFSDVGTTAKLDIQVNAIKTHPNGRILVAAGGADGKLLIINPESLAVENEIAVGHTPSGIELNEEGGIAYVTNRFNDNVSVVDLFAGKEVATIPVRREPMSIVRANGKLWVVNLLPVGRVDHGDAYSEVTVIDEKNLEPIKQIQLPNGATSAMDITASADGGYVYVTHILARYQVPTTQLDRGWMNTNALSVIDTNLQEWLNTVLLDELQRGAANLGAVAVTEDNKQIVVSVEGTHELIVVDREKLHYRLNLVEKGESHSPVVKKPEHVSMDLSFLSDASYRIDLKANGTRGLALGQNNAYTAMLFSDKLAKASLNGSPRVHSLLLNPDFSLTTAQKGDMIFQDADHCFQQWQSCASCHPGEARVDALNWDLLNDGIGNPKQTKSLLLSHVTPPVMVSGVRKDYTVATKAGFKHIFFVVPEEETTEAVMEYMAKLEPVPSPHLVEGKLSESALRGKKVFNDAGCKFCHSGPYHTNLKSYDVGTGGIFNDDTPLDTPTLVEVWRTAPYLKDGRAATMKDVLTTFNPEDKHGKTSDLSEQQIADLAEYILSL